MPRSKKRRESGARARRQSIAKKAAPRETGGKKKSKPRGKGQTENPAARGKRKLTQAYRCMFQARLFDAEMLDLARKGRSRFYASAAGHEAIQCAAGLVFRAGVDWFYPYYRDVAFVTTLGMGLQDLALNVLSKEQDPNTHGRERPLSFSSASLHIAPQSSVVGNHFTQAVGCAVGAKLGNEGEVVYVSSGEGACTLGGFWEALNWAAREALPIVFVVQRNDLAGSTPAGQDLAGGSVLALSEGFTGLERVAVDGVDLQACLNALRKAHDRARKGSGPTLIEAAVPRFEGHFALDDQRYRDERELKRERKRCPIAALKAVLLRQKLALPADLKKIEREAADDVKAAVSWAESQQLEERAFPPPAIYAESYPSETSTDEEAAKTESGFGQAIARALQEEFRRNQSLYLIARPLPGGGGVLPSLGERLSGRVLHGPLAADAAVAAGIGLAYRGYRSVIELSGAGALWQALPQLQEAATMCYRTSGHVTSPLVIRLILGAPTMERAQHPEGILAHLAGLAVVYPSNAADAKGLLKTALRGQDPVLCIEDYALYEAEHARAETAGEKFFVPIGRARVARSGTDVTLVTWGKQVFPALRAAEAVSGDGISVEVLDLRTIAPFDAATVQESIRKTGRALIVHEEIQGMGFGAEVAAIVGEQCFEHLDAPVRRLAGAALPFIPAADALARAATPQEPEIQAALRSLAAY